ncbi:hypothetical protein KC19_VG011200 [Ceratodon purpureus]|uniref:Uncharacterized protein n=1 Tax=Ceratodon purpureus TaxID=3225 RepID=A0A8T0HKV8_CERPU|nr:hypothetical protein KC19_VG011200 [Ceratodon purpureus]
MSGVELWMSSTGQCGVITFWLRYRFCSVRFEELEIYSVRIVSSVCSLVDVGLLSAFSVAPSPSSHLQHSPFPPLVSVSTSHALLTVFATFAPIAAFFRALSPILPRSE